MIIDNFAENPNRGGSPPKDSIFIKISILFELDSEERNISENFSILFLKNKKIIVVDRKQ